MNTTELLLAHFETIAEAPGGVARLRRLILQLAVQGRLVAQDPGDEPASVLLGRIRVEKARLGVKPKESERLTDASLLASLPPSWVWTTLSELGYVNPRNNVADEQEVTFVPMALVPQEYGEPVQTEVRQWGEVKKGFTHFAEGDVVLAKITPCFQNGKAAVMRKLRNGVGAGTTELHVFRPISDTVFSEYVYVYLKSPNFVREGIPRMTGTAGQKRVPNDYFALNPFPLPPLAEQRRIVERVDALMGLCDELEERQAREGEERRRLLRALIDALLGAGEAAAAWARLSDSFDLVLAAPEDVAPLRQAVLQLAVQGRLVEQNPEDEPASKLLGRIRAEKARLVREGRLKREETPRADRDTDTLTEMPTGWELSRLDDLLVLLRNGIAEAPSGSSGTPILRISALRPNAVNLDEVRFLPGPIEAYSDYVLQEDDLLFTRYSGNRDYVGICGVVPALPSHIVYPDKLIRGRLVEKLVVPKYVALAANVGISRAYIEQFLKTTAGQVGVAGRDLKLMPVPLPPLAEQHRIVARVEQLMALCDALEAKLREERAAAERLAEGLCAAVAAGRPAERGEVAVGVGAPAILELPRQVPALDLDAYAIFAARVVQQHQGTPTARTLGHVKLEKIAHLAEPYAGVDLGRMPRAMPRGPADFDLLRQVIERGRALNAFDAPAREGSEWGYQFIALQELDALAGRLDEVFGAQAGRLERLIALLVPLKSRQAEAVATLYAVWNDLLRAGERPDDEQIFAAFRAFHPKKERFQPAVLVRWLGWMREHGIVPDGSARPTLPANQRGVTTAHEVAAVAPAAQARPARRAAETSVTYDTDDSYVAAAALLAEHGALTNGDLQAALGLDGASARALLKRLVAEGLARQEGERRGARYVWTGRSDNTANQIPLGITDA